MATPQGEPQQRSAHSEKVLSDAKRMSAKLSSVIDEMAEFIAALDALNSEHQPGGCDDNR
jgi:hypothetical protein